MQTRRSDMNNEYHKETIDVCETKVIVLSSISEVKNKEVKNKEVKNVYHYGSNYDDMYTNITFTIEVACLEWYVKKYCVDNDIINTELEWILKQYWVNNNNIDGTELE